MRAVFAAGTVGFLALRSQSPRAVRSVLLRVERVIHMKESVLVEENDLTANVAITSNPQGWPKIRKLARSGLPENP